MLLSDANEMLKISSAQRAAMLGLFQGGSEAAGQRGFYGAGGDTPRGCPIPALGTWLPTAPEAPSLSRAIFGVQSSLPTAAQPSLGLGEPPNPPTPTPAPLFYQEHPPRRVYGLQAGDGGGPLASQLQPREKKKIKKKLQGSPRCPILPSGPRQWGLCPRTEPRPWGLCPRLGQRGGGANPCTKTRAPAAPQHPLAAPPPSDGGGREGALQAPQGCEPPPPEHTAAERGGHMLPASAPFCRSAAFDLPNSGAFKAPRRRAEAGGSGTHGSCSWGRGWGGGQGEVGGQEVDPGISIPWDPIPPHRDAASGGAK